MTKSAAPTIVKYPRTLVVDAVVAANASQPAVLSIPSDADFEWWWLTAFRTNTALKVQIQESATTRYLIYSQSGNPTSGSGGSSFNGILIDLLAGLVSNNGAFPQTVPYVMPANRLYNFTFTDSSGAQNTVELGFIGYGLLQFESSN